MIGKTVKYEDKIYQVIQWTHYQHEWFEVKLRDHKGYYKFLLKESDVVVLSKAENMILEQFLNKKAEEIDNPIRNWGVGFTAEVINEWINLQTQAKKLAIPDISGSFSAEDMIKAFNAGGKHIYECEANGKDKKCYCRNDNDCNQRHYISAEEWLKNYR